MEFGLTEEQRMLQESVKRFLEDKSPLDDVRIYASGDRSLATRLHEGLTELGVPGLLVPEDHGGLGLTFLDAALVQEMMGRYVAPAPYMASAVLATAGLLGAGTDGQKEEYLPKIASGEFRIGVAIAEQVGAREGAKVEASGGKLTGKAMFGLETQDATHILVADSAGALHLVDASVSGFKRNELTTIDRTRPLSELLFDGAEAEALSAENKSGQTAGRMISMGRVLLAADTLGAGDMMIEKAVTYAKDRKQFNRVIASFQAVKHMCAEMASELEPCRSLIWYAAYAHDERPDEAPLMSMLAKSQLADVGQFVARTATEVHGGMGFTDLMGLHYWFKRIGFNRQILGGPEKVREEAARLQGWAA